MQMVANQFESHQYTYEDKILHSFLHRAFKS